MTTKRQQPRQPPHHDYCVGCGQDGDFDLEYCCDGFECDCMGLPIEPPYCDVCKEDWRAYQIEIEEQSKKEMPEHFKQSYAMKNVALGSKKRKKDA